MAKLLDTQNGEVLKYNGAERIKRCITNKTAEKTSHGQRDVLLRFINYFPMAKSISINHGEQNVQESFREYLLSHLNLPEDQILTANSEVGVRIESNGIIGTFETHFNSIF